VLPQIAADALGVPVEDVDVRIGDTRYPMASVAGGSSGTNTWGSAIVVAAHAFRDKFGTLPAPGDEITGDVDQAPKNDAHASYAFGAQFAEARVNADTGEIRVPRLLGVFAAGRIINPRTARSQFIGGMTMGLSMPGITSRPTRTWPPSRLTGSTSTTLTSTPWAARASARSASSAPPRRWPTPSTTPPGSGSATCPSPSTNF
jgi:CO/xanthine dehydrogenase Mo-binding subunit